MKRSEKHIAKIVLVLFGVTMFFTPSNSVTMRLLAQVVSSGTEQGFGGAGTATVAPSDPAGEKDLSGFGSTSVTGDSQMQDFASSQETADKMAKRQQFLSDIKQQLQQAQSDYVDINRNVNDTKDKLLSTQEERLTLQNQVDILNDQIQSTVEITQNVLQQIQDKESQIEILKNDIEVKNLEIENQKKMMAEYLKVLYEQQNSMSDTTSTDEAVNVAKMLLSDQTPDEALRELKYYNVLEQAGRDIFDKLETLVSQQQSEQINFENSRNKLEMLYRQLQDQQSTLLMQQQAKAQLLTETKGQETIYQQLLDQTTQEQGQALQDIHLLSQNLQFIQDKIAELGDKFNPDDYKSVLDQDTTNVYQYMKDNPDGDFHPSWPVSPSRGISAYFHDASYLKAMGIPHEAVDIRALQSTPIHAPADGVVYKTRDNGYGYSYIILAHSGGFMTLYGHVSDIEVKEGQKIKQGQVIGLSGATPGTKGAGLMTTGPHLHFEVMKGGKHVDPLDYLPLSYLPLNSLPEKYLSRVTGESYNVSRTADETLGDANDSQQLLQMAEQSGNAEVNGGAVPDALPNGGDTNVPVVPVVAPRPAPVPVMHTSASAPAVKP